MRIRFRNKTLIGIAMLSLLVFVLYFSLRRWNGFNRLSGVRALKKKQKFSIAELMGSSNVFEVVKPNLSTILSQPSIPFLKVIHMCLCIIIQ